jgi:uncharacterized protein YbjQ (UPF0145 family)
MSTTICPKCNYTRQASDTVPAYACPSCGIIYAKFDAAADAKLRIFRARSSGDWSGIAREAIPPEYHAQAAAQLVASTTHKIPGREVVGIVDVVSAQCALGMNVVKDVLSGVVDVIGGRSGSTQTVLRDARRTAMAELRGEAFALGADAVVGVSLHYSEFSGGGKSMLFVVATGTAVRLGSIPPVR